MPLLSVEWTPEGVCHGVPFPFTPMPIEPGPALDADIALYRKLCKQVGVPPSAPMLLVGDSRRAKRLFLRRAASPDDWKEFTKVFFSRFPKIHHKMTTARIAVTAIPSGYLGRSVPLVPEIVVGWALLRAVEPKFTIMRDEPLPGAPARRCDFSVYAPDGRCRTRIEIAGMADRHGQPRTFDGYAYMARQPNRVRAYEWAGLPPDSRRRCGRVVRCRPPAPGHGTDPSQRGGIDGPHKQNFLERD